MTVYLDERGEEYSDVQNVERNGAVRRSRRPGGTSRTYLDDQGNEVAAPDVALAATPFAAAPAAPIQHIRTPTLDRLHLSGADVKAAAADPTESTRLGASPAEIARQEAAGRRIDAVTGIADALGGLVGLGIDLSTVSVRRIVGTTRGAIAAMRALKHGGSLHEAAEAGLAASGQGHALPVTAVAGAAADDFREKAREVAGLDSSSETASGPLVRAVTALLVPLPGAEARPGAVAAAAREGVGAAEKTAEAAAAEAVRATTPSALETVEGSGSVVRGAERRLAQRRAAVAAENGLPESHPAVQRLVAADHDELTGVLNRDAYQRATAPGRPPPAAVSQVDIAGAGATNAAYGEGHTDSILAATGRRLQDVVGDRGVVYRKGGDEFVVHWNDATEAAQVHPELSQALGDAEVVVTKDGETVAQWQGIDHYHGHGATFDEASQQLYRSKPQPGQPGYKSLPSGLAERIDAGTTSAAGAGSGAGAGADVGAEAAAGSARNEGVLSGPAGVRRSEDQATGAAEAAPAESTKAGEVSSAGTEAKAAVEAKASNTLESVEGTGTARVRTLASGVESKAIESRLTDSFGDLPEYRRVSMQDQAAKAAALLTHDPVLAHQVAMGDSAAPHGVLPESVFIAVENKAIADGDVATLQRLATSSGLTTEATTMGQRIRTLAERQPNSPVAAMQDIAKAREAAVAKTVAGGDVAAAKTAVVDEIKSSISRAAPKRQSWSEFIESIRCK